MTDPRPEPMGLPSDPDAPDTMRAPVDEDARPVPPPNDPDEPVERRPPGDPGLTA
jgi:hypothetical protein